VKSRTREPIPSPLISGSERRLDGELPDRLNPALLPAGARGLRSEILARRGEWLACVEELAAIESPSTDPDAQRPILDLLSRHLGDVGYRLRRIPGTARGGALLAVPPRRAGGPIQLLIGHCDTVWPRGTLRDMPLRRVENRLLGPGVFDMKGGLAHIVVALRVLAELDLVPVVAPVVFVNSDEEVGSPESTRQVRRLARAACRVLVMEPALGPEGKLKTVRKGTGKFSIRVFGVSAHAGLDPEKGASAIQELAHVIQSLHALTDPERGIVVNVGEIRGGLRSNVVAAEAGAEVDVRINSSEEGRWVEERIRAIEPIVPGCRIEIRGQIDRPPLEPTVRNRSLWAQARAVAAELGMTIDEGKAGGASDGNTASRFAPTLDGLGAVGDGAHAVHEFLDIDRSLERCALLAGLILAPPLPVEAGAGERAGGAG